MSLASQIERVGQKLAKYQGKIDEAKEQGLYTRDPANVEDRIKKIWKLQRKARGAVKKLRVTERKAEVTKVYADVHRAGEAAARHLVDFRAELMLANVSAGLRAGAAPAAPQQAAAK